MLLLQNGELTMKNGKTYHAALRSFGTGIKAGRIYKTRRLPKPSEGTLAVLDDNGDSRLFADRHFERAFPHIGQLIAVEARYTWEAFKAFWRDAAKCDPYI